MWFGILGIVIAVSIVTTRQARDPAPMAIFIVPLIMMVFGYLLMKKLIFDLADEVWEGGDFLKIRFGDNEERIPFSNIANINYMMMNPPRATLLLRNPCRFGKEIAFCPLTTFADFKTSLNFRNTIIEDLVHKVDAARLRS